MQLQTKRLVIRDYRDSDIPDMLEIFGDSLVMEFCEPPYDEARLRKALPLLKKVSYAVTLDGKVIGHALFKQLPMEEDGIYEIGWIFGRKYWGRGYAYEAAQALVDYGFRQLHLHKICAETVDPAKSGGLAQRLGMEPEGRFRAHTRDLTGAWADLFWYAIVNSEE
ncbi:MAG: GNAT family N-acetyltransferase [Eubacteriales bacterium]|nr:GNAT family N-acetyltransferase [Eubacteriales bacterium]